MSTAIFPAEEGVDIPPYGLSLSPQVFGHTEPRLGTPPLRVLTPETSYGFAVIDFARDVLKQPMDPWEAVAVIRAGELLEDGRPRFRKVLVLVARQNGKTHLCVVLALYWLFVIQVGLVLGTSTKVEYAMESLRKAHRLARKTPALAQFIPDKGGFRKANGEQQLWRATPEEEDADDGSRYKIAASNEEGGRSLTINRLILDELRQHYDYAAWDASVPAMNADPYAQAFAISNMGSDRSVVLNDLRDAALEFIKSGIGDPRLGLLEWSSPEGASPDDVEALAAANPNLGYRISIEDLLGEAKVAILKGGEKLSGFRTEVMCQRVRRMNPAVDPEAWEAALSPGDLSEVRTRVACCVDVSLDGLHATLSAAAVLPDGRVRLEIVRAWDGVDATKNLRRELPGLVAKVKPRVLGWFPGGPAASVAAALAENKRAGWPPAGVKIEAIKADAAAVCMGFSELVTAEELVHSGDPLQDDHVGAAEKLLRGDAWVFGRKGGDHVDAAYSGAGATHLARTLPKSAGRPRIIVAP